LNAFSQHSDFIILKKGRKTIQTFFSGRSIEFVTVNGAYRNGWITGIKNDSIYLKEYLIRQVPTTLGFTIADTAGSFSYIYHYNQVGKIGKDHKKFNVSGSGAALMGGGIVLTLASGVVFLADREKFSPELLGAAAGLGVIGYFMSKAGQKGIVIGKNNYRLEYMSTTVK